MKFTIGEKTLQSEILQGAGSVGFDVLHDKTHHKKIGATVLKTITKEERQGNERNVLKKLPFGILNNIGLRNPGKDIFIKDYLPLMKDNPNNFIVSVADNSIQEYADVILDIEKDTNSQYIFGYELNVSCPNVKGGTSIGCSDENIRQLLALIKQITDKPVLIKLPADIYHMQELVCAACDGKADAIVISNSIPSIIVEPNKWGGINVEYGGLSGDCVLPIFLLLVYQLEFLDYVDKPIIACGGITKPEHALYYLKLGASAVQVVSGNFSNRSLAEQCYDRIEKYNNQE